MSDFGWARRALRLPPVRHVLIIRIVARAFGIRVAEIVGKRKTDIGTTRARMISAWALRRAGYSFPQAGRALARDHTTVMAAVRTIEKRARADERLSAILVTLEATMRNRGLLGDTEPPQ